MAFKGESYIPLIVRVKPAEGDIWRVRDNGMLFGIPLKGGDFIEWTGSAWQLRPDLHYKLDDGTGTGVQDDAITTEFAPLEDGSYPANTLRMYNGLLYKRNNQAGDDTEWVASHWTKTNVILQMPNPMYGLPLVKGANGIVTNNGRDLVVTGQNAWAEGRGAVVQVQCTAAVEESNQVPVSNTEYIKPGMQVSAVGMYFGSGDCIVTAVNYKTNTLTLNMQVTFAADTYVTILGGAVGYRAHAEGLGGFAAGDDSHAEGTRATARGTASHAGGMDTLAAGEASFATGLHSVTSNKASFAAGYYAYALGYHSCAIGNTSNIVPTIFTVQSAEYDAETGEFTLTLDDDVTFTDWAKRGINRAWLDDQYNAWAEPASGASNKIVVDETDFPEGTTVDSFIGMQVQLPNMGALYEYDVAVGQRAVACGGAATALGYQSTALESQATALHGGTATKMNSLAIGYGSTASEVGSMVMGIGLNMQHRDGLALGKWNSDDNVPFVIGSGSDKNHRTDIFKIDDNNHVWIKNSQGTLVDLTAALITANVIG